MTPFVIFLVLLSAVMHAAWNLMARRHRTEVVFFRRMLLVVALAGLMPAAVSEALTRSLPPMAWLYVVGSGCCFGAYFYALAHAYECSEFTVVYPVARSLPVLLVGLADVLRGRPLSSLGWLGMALVVCGCFFAPLHSFRELDARRYVHRHTPWMALAAIFTVGFTVFDKMASEIVKQGPGTAARYGYVMYLAACLTYLLLYHRFRARVDDHQAVGWGAPLLAAALTFCGYWLVLWAYQKSTGAGYILAFRQFSVVIGVIVAFILYRERGKVPRLTATALITIGLVIIALWGR